jgi:hypothetical protein
MSAYIHSLQQMQPAPTCDAARPPLETRFLEWINNLPEFARNRPFSMREFEVALGTQGRFLSPVLLRLGWRRQRRWSSQGQYHRYWVPRELPR